MVRTCLASYAPKVFGSTADQTSRKTLHTGQSGSRNDPFDLIRDGFGNSRDIKLGQIGTESRIHAGKRKENDSDSERYLTKGDNHIHVGRSVDVESL